MRWRAVAARDLPERASPAAGRMLVGSSRQGALPAVPHVLVLGPARGAVSGVATHLNRLFDSDLTGCFRLTQYQVGSAGRVESPGGRLLRALTSPLGLAGCLSLDVPNIVHINTSFNARGYWRDLAYLGVAKAFGCKVAYQVHGGPLPQDFFRGSRVLSALLRRVLCWADAVVVISTWHMQAYGEFSPSANLVMIANGVEIPETDLSVERYVSSGPLEVVYFGRLVRAKGVFDIIEAARILRGRGIAIRLGVAGCGPAEAELRRAVDGAGLAGRVRFLGAVQDAGKRELWNRAHVLALPSHAEGLPYALLECMAAGIVPVVTAVGAIGDAVQDHVHGILVSPRNPTEVADALQVLHEDREGLHRMALAARQRILDRYSVTRLQSEFRKLYAELVS